MGHSRPLFSLFSSFLQTVNSKYMFNKSCWWLNLNPGPLVLEATTLSQPKYLLVPLMKRLQLSKYWTSTNVNYLNQISKTFQVFVCPVQTCFVIGWISTFWRGSVSLMTNWRIGSLQRIPKLFTANKWMIRQNALMANAKLKQLCQNRYT